MTIKTTIRRSTPTLLQQSLLLGFVAAMCAPETYAAANQIEHLEPIQRLKVVEPMAEDRDVSAVAMVDDLLVLAVDEGRDLQWFQLMEGSYQRVATLPLIGKDEEVDVEGLAVDSGFLYVIGSHSATRQRVRKGRSHAKNRKRLTRTDRDRERDTLLRLRLPLSEDDSEPEEMTPALRPTLDDNPYFELFRDIPSKENGIDIEGLAVREGQVFLGFRGPVLRGGFAPVMTFPFGSPTDHEVLFVQLGGRGIRSLERTKDGFLIIGGPVGDSDQSYQLYEWDGRDCLPGRDGNDKRQPPCQLIALGSLPSDGDTKAEGLTILEETPTHYRLLIVFDGADRGAPMIFRVPR